MTKLNESMGLLAYYESQSQEANTLPELVRARKSMINDFLQSENDDDINFLLWVINDYPRFLNNVISNRPFFSKLPKAIKQNKEKIVSYLEEDKKVNINKKIDNIVLESIDNKLIKKYIKSKISHKSFDADALISSSDSDEVIKFLLVYEQRYNNRVKELFEIKK